MSGSISYLVSTAGHAQHQNELYPHDITSILQLIQEGSEELGDEKVVGFSALSHGGGGEGDRDGIWECLRLSFRELLSLTGKLVTQLEENGLRAPSDVRDVVSLLCPTGLDFLLAWIGLMRMGYGVVFTAPQCSPSAINHLVESTSSSRLIYHPKYADLARSAKDLREGTVHLELPLYTSYSHNDTLPAPSTQTLGCSVADSTTTSHVFHTSGTSGTPKPIPYTHVGSVAPLPRRGIPSYLSTSAATSASVTTGDEDKTILPSESAAFTTTPLFHGGVSDLLRAWMARSMIYFYPTSDNPVTATNVVYAVQACNGKIPDLPGFPLTEEGLAERVNRFKVTSFLSVPYILTILAEDATGPAMEMLQVLDFVSTGGAPLDKRVGDTLVDHGVRLVSRLGSSECGFLLSSHRHYETEEDWEWLRNDSPYASAIRFEPVEGDQNKFEMVVTDKWASKTKSNRDDGSYASGDLYEPHPTKQNVWRYAGRGDDVIVMSNGEKASPGPFETALRALQLLSDSLVVGSDRPQLGLLLFPRSSSVDHAQLLEEAKPLLEEANSASPSFAQISIDMCSVVTDNTKTLPKSSKGTVQRGVAYDVFKAEIESLYEGSAKDDLGSPVEKRSKEEIAKHIQAIISDVASSRLKIEGLDENTDLFSWGLDSLMATRVRSAMQKALNTGGKTLSGNVVFERPSIARLAQYVYDLQEQNHSDIDDQNHHGLMIDLVRRFGRFEAQSGPSGNSGYDKETEVKTMLLTGGTGSLGAFLIDQWLTPTAISESSDHRRVICLVRASDDSEAQDRILNSLKQRGIPTGISSRIEYLASDLEQTGLGLTEEVYKSLAERIDAIVHAAWPVHFASSLVSFESNIKGTRNLLDLLGAAKNRHSKLHYCSSLASVLANPGSILNEEPTHDPSSATGIGYSQSKWVTENVCEAASISDVLKGRVHIQRVGQLCGDTKSGHWNEKEGWPLMFRTADTTGTLPQLVERPSFLPVDLAAAAIVDVLTGVKLNSPLIYHIVHPDPIEWSTILDGLSRAGLQFEAVRPQVWLDKVAKSLVGHEEDPSGQMLSMWESAYGDDTKPHQHVDVDVTHAKAISSTLRDIEPINQEDIVNMVAAWRKTGFLR
ncbi:hypothetical protein IAU59_001440 [Kwoniella sp. CBS 9459]